MTGIEQVWKTLEDLVEIKKPLEDLLDLWRPQPPQPLPPLPTGGVKGLDWNVQLVDSSGNPISVGGGTQYADGTAAATPTGTAVMWNDVGTERVASAAKPLPVNVVAGSGSGVSVVDEAAWTAATSVFVPGGGVFNDSAAALTSGQQGTQRLTAQRGGHVNLRTAAGVEVPLPAALVGGRLDVNAGKIPGTVSTANSSTATLTLGSVFTGTSEDVSGYASIVVNVFADVASAASGLSLQFSSNGTNWDIAYTYTVAASTGLSIPVTAAAQFFRIVYTNGGTNQATFRLQAVFHQVQVTSSVGVGAGMVQGADATGGTITGRPVLVGVNDGGGLVRIWNGVNQSNNSTGNGIGSIAPMLWDGTNFQKRAQVSQVSGTTGVGLAAVGPLCQAFAHGANPASVTAGQYALPPANRAGIPFVIGGHPNPITVRANFATAQTNTVLVAGSGGSKIVVTGFMVTAHNANTANVSVVIGLAAATTPTTTQVVGAHPGIAAGSGFGRGAGAGILAVGADSDALLLTSSVPSGGSIDVLVQYYTVPS